MLTAVRLILVVLLRTRFKIKTQFRQKGGKRFSKNSILLMCHSIKLETNFSTIYIFENLCLQINNQYPTNSKILSTKFPALVHEAAASNNCADSAPECHGIRNLCHVPEFAGVMKEKCKRTCNFCEVDTTHKTACKDSMMR